MNHDIIKALEHAEITLMYLTAANDKYHLESSLQECRALLKGLETDVVLTARGHNKRLDVIV